MSWADVAHASLPSSCDEDLTDWLLTHADESLLHLGIAHIPVLSPSGAASLSTVTAGLIGRGGDSVGSMHKCAPCLSFVPPLLYKVFLIFM